MRVAVGRFWTESSSLSPLLANRAMFVAGALIEGEVVLRFGRNTRTEVGGVLGALDEAGVEAVPVLAEQAACAGPIDEECWTWIRGRLFALLDQAGPVDAVLMSLHGATVAVNEDDCCGSLVAGMRKIVGPDVPIVATLDMHGNPTR